jgi:hypothetical protein
MLHSTVKPFAESMPAHLLAQTKRPGHLQKNFDASASMVLLVHGDARDTAATVVTYVTRPT